MGRAPGFLSEAGVSKGLALSVGEGEKVRVAKPWDPYFFEISEGSRGIPRRRRELLAASVLRQP